jgi:hypothetical protein
MTTIGHTPVPVGEPPAMGMLRTLIVGWEISPDAIRGLALPTITAMNGQAAAISGARLEWRLGLDRAAAVLRLRAAGGEVVIPLLDSTPAQVRRDDQGLVHVVAGEALTLALRGHRLVYARTTLLGGLLGLPGGVYDRPTIG